MPGAEDSRSEPSGHSGGEQRRARRASGEATQTAAKRKRAYAAVMGREKVSDTLNED